jgi:hypothetical protein
MPDYTETVFTWLKYLSWVVLALMALAVLYAVGLSLANWAFIAV